MTFKTLEDNLGWDSQPAVYFREDKPQRSFKSLRELLREDDFKEDDIDVVTQWFEEGAAEDINANEYEGIKRDALTAMQLRIAPILDQFQDTIFRLPIDRQIAVMGPPGTGKTTTMVRRLRQKLDFAYLEEDEKSLVEGADAAGLMHADSWILFTPTELLRLYVKEALGKEGVPAHDERLKTWDEYRWDVARNRLGILRKAGGSGLTMPQPADDAWLADGTLLNQIGWFQAFDDWQAEDFINQLQVEATRLAEADDARTAIIGRRVAAALARSDGNIVRLIGELAGLREELIALARQLSENTGGTLAYPLKVLASENPGFLDALSVKITAMLAESRDDGDEEEPDDEEGDDEILEDTENARPTLQGRRQVADVFRRAMRTLAMRQASGRRPVASSRAGQILAFLQERDLSVPDLKDVGQILLLQRAAGRIANAPSNYLRRVPARYRRFRRVMRSEGLWYAEKAGSLSQVHPAEVDLIMLCMLNIAGSFQRDRVVAARLAERTNAVFETVAALQRNQILVDEATDFSPVQLACMAALAGSRTRSFFLSGDFNQRLTLWGSRTTAELEWVAPQLEWHPINVTYRQSRKLADFARLLAASQGTAVEQQAPDYGDNAGFDPVCGLSLNTEEAKTAWLVERIKEIQALSDGNLPTIAILLPDRGNMADLTEALNVKLADLSLKAKAFADGEAIGKTNDVRIFPIEHIKGLEFEAVFFLDVDLLAERHPEMFNRYIYVGATRAATFLGLTCGGGTLPDPLSNGDFSYVTTW